MAGEIQVPHAPDDSSALLVKCVRVLRILVVIRRVTDAANIQPGFAPRQ
jgi:hypothetical protein